MKEEYTQTQFVTDLTSGNVPKHFFIITAHNPFGSKVSDSRNAKMNEQLLVQLKHLDWPHFSVTGQCADHAEAGYGIVCTRTEAISLGEKFRQDAIYEVRDNEVILVDCKGHENDEVIGLWSDLQAPTS